MVFQYYCRFSGGRGGGGGLQWWKVCNITPASITSHHRSVCLLQKNIRWNDNKLKQIFAVKAIAILFKTKSCTDRCKISFVWSTVPVRKKMFRKGQNVNILTILHVHQIQFRAVSVDPSLPETFIVSQKTGFAGTNLFRLDVIWMKRLTNKVNLFWSVRSRAVFSQTTFARNHLLFGKQLFHEYENEYKNENHLN